MSNIAYVKITDMYVRPNPKITDSFGNLLDDSDDIIEADIYPYEYTTMLSTDYIPLTDEFGNEIFS